MLGGRVVVGHRRTLESEAAWLTIEPLIGRGGKCKCMISLLSMEECCLLQGAVYAVYVFPGMTD